MNFVSGGLLVGDKIEELIPKVNVTSSQEVQPNKKRKRSVVSEAPSSTESNLEPGDPMSSIDPVGNAGRQMQRKRDTEDQGEPDTKSNVGDSKKERTDHTKVESQSPTDKQSLDSESKAEKQRRKQERKERREAKRPKKERRRRKEEAEAVNQVTSPIPTDTNREPVEAKSRGAYAHTKSVPRGRNAVRQKYMQSKKMSSLDPKALNE
ncbi:hypothetical protein LTS18_000335, partial [Coniosporium uncinatum]